jgi:RHS repeat-associated protein
MADALHSVISRASYTSENLLRSISGGGSATLAYDPAMRLFQVAGTSTTRFAYDGLDLIGEYSSTNGLLRRYVHGPGMDEPLVQYEGAGTIDRRFLQADERGSITAISDSSGNLLTANSYDEYGIPGASNAGRFQYTGQTWLPEVGLYYYKARMYSPTLGRFMQTDPIGYSGDGPSLYGYTLNDPVNYVDRLGLDAVNCIGWPSCTITASGSTCPDGWTCYSSIEIHEGPTYTLSGNEVAGGGSGEKPQKSLCAKASSNSNDFVDATLADESSAFSIIGNIADAAVVVGYVAAPFNPAVGAALILGGKITGAVVNGVQGGSAVIDAAKNGNYGNLLSFAGGQALGIVGGRVGARFGTKVFGNEQIRNSLGQFAGKRANGLRQAGQTITNSLGSKVCPN